MVHGAWALVEDGQHDGANGCMVPLATLLWDCHRVIMANEDHVMAMFLQRNPCTIHHSPFTIHHAPIQIHRPLTSYSQNPLIPGNRCQIASRSRARSKSASAAHGTGRQRRGSHAPRPIAMKSMIGVSAGKR